MKNYKIDVLFTKEKWWADRYYVYWRVSSYQLPWYSRIFNRWKELKNPESKYGENAFPGDRLIELVHALKTTEDIENFYKDDTA